MFLPSTYRSSLSKMQAVLICFCQMLQRKSTLFCTKSICFSRWVRNRMACSFRFIIFRVNPYFLHLFYFIFVSVMGFLFLKLLGPKDPTNTPRDLDLFFTSVSAVTVSSMSTVEMEVFSNAQFMVITILMLIGGEVFNSMLNLQLMKIKFRKMEGNENGVDSVISVHSSFSGGPLHREEAIELGLKVAASDSKFEKSGYVSSMVNEELTYNCIRLLSFMVIGYLLVIHATGSLLVLIYVTIVPSAGQVLSNKGISKQIFAIFTSVSSFANGGFIPTNENMVVFRNNSGLLLLVIPQILLGNTLFPVCLRLLAWVLAKIRKRVELDHLLRNPEDIGYDQLLQPLHCLLLIPTAISFILVQFLLFCSMHWHSEALSGMSSYQKIVGALFQSVNSRHAGESVVDISTLAPAILVLYIVMMYLPPYTAFLPALDEKKRPKRAGRFSSLILSRLSYLSICIILVCIAENKKISEDPLNFGVSNIVFEVISAYGNVGFSTGYSCQRRLNQNTDCKDATYGFVGRWSITGKLVLIFVMFLGRLKKFNVNGGKAWKFQRENLRGDHTDRDPCT